MKTQALTCLLVLVPLIGRSQATLSTVKLPYGAVLTLRRIPFHDTGQKMVYSRISGLAIGTVLVYGTDGEKPRYKLAGASLLLHGTRYQLPVSRMYDPWFGLRPEPRLFRLTKWQRGYVLHGMFSDGAGGYTAKWWVAGRSAKRIVLSNEEQYFF